MGCFSSDNAVGDEKPAMNGERIKRDRHCTDILFCLLFFGFWVGMVAVGGLAFTKGVPERLWYGIDSHGMLCGTKNDIKNSAGVVTATVDLRDRKNLYYMDVFDLMDPLNFAMAKTVCVSSCPSNDQRCSVTSFTSDPCDEDKNYYCDYYSQDATMNGKLTNVDDWDVQWYSEMASYTGTECAVGWLDSFPDSILTAMGLSATDTACGKYYQMYSLYPQNGPCYPVWLETFSYYNRCFPTVSTDFLDTLGTSMPDALSSSTMNDQFSTASERLSRYIADITRGWLIILGAGLGVSVGVSCLWMVLLRYCAGVMCWATVITINVVTLFCCLLAAAKADLLGWAGSVGEQISDTLPEEFDPSTEDKKVWEVITYVLAAFAALLLLMTLVMIRRIMVAIACLKVASQAVGAMPMILIWPVVLFSIYVCFIIYWALVAAFLYSTGNVEEVWVDPITFPSYSLSSLLNNGDGTTAEEPPPRPDDSTSSCADSNDCYYDIVWEKDMRYVFLYHVFGLFWTNQFILGVGYMTVAGAIAQFYWAQGIRSQMESSTPIITSLKNTFRYHTGSVALGALLVAIVQFVRFLMEMLERRFKKMTGGNAAASWAFCCCKYCLWYLEKVLKFINRNAYIMIAVTGKGYCKSAVRAVYLLVSNALRLAAVNIVGDLLLFLGKLVVLFTAGACAFGLSDLDYYTNETDHPDTFLSSPVLVILFSVLIAYVVAEIFFGVYEMAVDTVLLSFCEDCEQNDGKPKAAPKLLLKAIGQGKRFQKFSDQNKVEAEPMQ